MMQCHVSEPRYKCCQYNLMWKKVIVSAINAIQRKNWLVACPLEIGWGFFGAVVVVRVFFGLLVFLFVCFWVGFFP